jgi:hypothetical protein
MTKAAEKKPQLVQNPNPHLISFDWKGSSVTTINEKICIH